MRRLLELVLLFTLLLLLLLCIEPHDAFLLAPVSFVPTGQILLLWNRLKDRKYDGTGVNASNEFSDQFDANIVELVGKVKALVNDYINRKRDGAIKRSHVVNFNNPNINQLRSLSDGKYLCIDLSRYINSDKLVTEQLNNAFLVIKGKYSNRFKRNYVFEQAKEDYKTYEFSIWRQKLVVDTYNVGPGRNLDAFLHSYDLTNQYEYYAFDYSSSEPDHYFDTNEISRYGLSATSYWFTDNLCINSYLSNERTKHLKSDVLSIPFIPDESKRAFAFHKLIKEGNLDGITFYDYNVTRVKILRAAEHIPFGLVNEDNYKMVFMDLLYSSMPTKIENLADGRYKRYMYPYFYVPTVFYYESFQLDHHNNARNFNHEYHNDLDPLLNHKVFNNMKTYAYFYPVYYNGSNWVTMNANLDQSIDLFGYNFVMPEVPNTEFRHVGFGGSFSYGMTLKYLPGSKYRYGTYFTPYYTSEYIVSGYASAAMMHFYGSQDAVRFGLSGRKVYMENRLNISGKDLLYHRTTTIPTGLMPMYQEFYPIYLIDSYCFTSNSGNSILLKPPTFSRYSLTPRQYNFHFRIPFGIQENERRDNTVLKAYARANSYYHINPSDSFSNVTPTYAYFTALSDYHTMLPPFNRQMALLAVKAIRNMNDTIQNANALSILFCNKQVINNRIRDVILTNFCNWVNYPGTYSPLMNEKHIRDTYLFATSPTNIRGLLWSNVYFRKLIDPGVAHELGFTSNNMPTDDNSVDKRLRRLIPSITPFGITNAPVRFIIYNDDIKTAGRLWRMNIYSGSMNGNYIDSNTNEKFFQHRTIALALMSYTLAVPDYPDASPTIPWCWQSFDSMLSYAPEPDAGASTYGLGYEYRFAYFHNNIHPIPDMQLSLGSASINSYRLPLLTYNHLLPLFFVVLTDRNAYWQQYQTTNGWLPDTEMNTTSTELTYLYIVPPDYIYNLKLPGPIRSISTHRLTSDSLSDIYTVARYEFFAPYLPLYPYRDVNTTLPRFDIKPHLKAFNIYRDIRPLDSVSESSWPMADYRINNPNTTPASELTKLRSYGYYNSFLGYFFVDVGGSFTAIERINKLVSVGDSNAYDRETIRYLVVEPPQHVRILINNDNPLLGTDFNPFYTDSGSVFITSEVRWNIVRNISNNTPIPLDTLQQGYVITMNGLTNLMFSCYNTFSYYGKKLWSTFDDFRSYYISGHNILTWQTNNSVSAVHDIQRRFFAYSVLRNIALINRIFFPNVRVRPLLSMVVEFAISEPPLYDLARRRVAYYKIYDDIVTKGSYYQTDLLTPMYITYNPLGAYVMVHEKDRDYIRKLMNDNILPSTDNPDPVPFNANYNAQAFYETVYNNYELIGPWNFHNLLFPTFSTGEVRQPQAWAFSHPRMWPRPIMAYYYPSRVTPNPAYYLSGIIRYEEKTYSGIRPYHVLDYRNTKDFVLVIRLYKVNDEIVAESLNNDFVAVYHDNKVYLRTKTQFVEPIVPRTPKGTNRVRHSLLDLVGNLNSNLEKFEAIVGGKILSDLVSNASIRDNYVANDYLHPIEDGVSAGSAYYIINEASIINCFGNIYRIRNNELSFCDRTNYPYDKDEQDIEIVVPDDDDCETTAFGWSEALYIKFKTEDVFTKAVGKNFEVNKYKGRINIVPEHPISYGIIENSNILKKQRDYITMMPNINYLYYDRINSNNTIPAIKKAEHASIISNRFDDLSSNSVVYNLPRVTYPNEFSTSLQRLIFEIDLPAQTLQYSQFSDALRYGRRDANTMHVSTIDGLSIYNNKDLGNLMLHETERFDEPMIVYDNPYNPKNVLFMFIDNLTAERANANILNDDFQFNLRPYPDHRNFINVGPNPFSGFWHMEYVGFITDYAWNKWSAGLDAEPRQGILQKTDTIYTGFDDVFFYRVELTNSPKYGRYRINNKSSVTFAQDNITLNDYINLHKFSISALSLNTFAPFLDFTIYTNYFGGTPKTVYYSDDYTPNNLYLPSSYYNFEYSVQNTTPPNKIQNPLYRFRVEDINTQDENHKFVFPGKDIVTRLFSFRLPVVTKMIFVKDELPRYRIYPTSTLHREDDTNVYDRGFYHIVYDYSLGNVPKWMRPVSNNSLGAFYGSNSPYFYYNIITPITNIQDTLKSQFNTDATKYDTVEYNNDPLVTDVGRRWSSEATRRKRLVYVVPPKPFDDNYQYFYRIGNLFAWPYDLIGANVQAECYYKNPNPNYIRFDYNLKAWYWPYIGRYAENLMHLNAQRAAFSPFTGYGYWMRYSDKQNIITPLMALWFVMSPNSIPQFLMRIRFSVNSEYGYSYGRVVNPYKDFIAYERPYSERIVDNYIDNSLILNKYTREFPDRNNPTRLLVVSDVIVSNVADKGVFDTMVMKTSASIEIPQGFIYNMLISNYHPPVPLFAVHSISKSYKIPEASTTAQNIRLRRTNYGRWASSQLLYTSNYVCFDTPPYGTPLGGSFYLQQYMLSNVPLYYYYNEDTNEQRLFNKVHFNQELALKHFVPPELYYLVSYPIFLTNQQVSNSDINNPIVDYQYEPFYMSTARLNLVYVGTQKFYPLVPYGIPYVKLFYPFMELIVEYNEKSITENFSPDIIRYSKTLYRYPLENLDYKNRGMPMYTIYIDGQYDFNHTPSNVSGNMAISQSAMLSYLQKDDVNYNDETYTSQDYNPYAPDPDMYKYYAYYDATIVREDNQFMTFLENNRSALAMAGSMNFLSGTSPNLKTAEIVLDKLREYYGTDTMAYDMMLFYFHAHDEEHTSYRLDRIGVLGHPKDQNTKVTPNLLYILQYSPNTLHSINRLSNPSNIYTIDYYNISGSYASTKMILERDVIKRPLSSDFWTFPNSVYSQGNNDIRISFYITSRLIYEDLLLQSYHYRSYVPLPNEGIYIPNSQTEFNLMLNQSISAKALFFVGNPYYIRSELANKANIYFVYNNYKVLSQFYKKVRRYRYRVRMPMVKGLRVSVGVMPLGYNATHAYSVGPAGAVGARNYSQYTDRQFGEYHLPARETTNFSSTGSMPLDNSRDVQVNVHNVIQGANGYFDLSTAKYVQSPKSLFHTITNIRREERVIFWARNPYLIDVLTIYPKPLIIDPVSIYQKEALSCASLYLSDYLAYVPYGALRRDVPRHIVIPSNPDIYPEHNQYFINRSRWPFAVIDIGAVGDMTIASNIFPDYVRYYVTNNNVVSAPSLSFSFPIGAIIEASGLGYDKWSYHTWYVGYWLDGIGLGTQHLPVPRRWLTHMVMYTNTLPMLTSTMENRYYRIGSNDSYNASILQLHNPQTFFLSMYGNPTHTMLYLSHVLGSSAYNNKVVYEMRFDMDLLYNLTDTVTYDNYWPHMQHTEVNMRNENKGIKNFLISPHHYYTVKALLKPKYYDLQALNVNALISYNRPNEPISFFRGTSFPVIYGLVHGTIKNLQSLYWTKRDLIFTTTYNIIDHAYHPMVSSVAFYGIAAVSSSIPVYTYEWLGGLYFLLNSNVYLINHNCSAIESELDAAKVQPRILIPEATYVPVFYTFNTSLSTRRLSLYRTAIFASDIEPQPVFQYKGESTVFDNATSHTNQQSDIDIANSIFTNSMYNIEFDNVIVSNRMQTPLNDMYMRSFEFNLFYNTSPNAAFTFKYNVPNDGLFYLEFNGFGRFEYNINYANLLVRNPAPLSVFNSSACWPINKFLISDPNNTHYNRSAVKLLGDDVNMLFRFPKEMVIVFSKYGSANFINDFYALSVPPLFVKDYAMWDKPPRPTLSIAVDAFSQMSYIDTPDSDDHSLQLGSYRIVGVEFGVPDLKPIAFNMTYNTRGYNIWNFTHRLDYFWFSWVLHYEVNKRTARLYAAMFRTPHDHDEFVKQPVLRANTLTHYMYDPLYLDTGRIFIRPQLYSINSVYNLVPIHKETTSDVPFFVIADAIYMNAPLRYTNLSNRDWISELYSFDHLDSPPSSGVSYYYMNGGIRVASVRPCPVMQPSYRAGSNVMTRPYGGYDQAIIKQGTGASVANFYHLVEGEPSMTRLWSIQCGLNTAPLTRTGDELTHEYGVPVSNNHMITSHGLHYEATIVDYFLGNMFLYREDENSLYEGHPLPHPNFIIFGKSDNIYKFLGNPVPEVTYSAPPMSYTIEIGLRLYTALNSSDGTINRDHYQDITIRPYQKYLSFSTDTDTSVQLPHAYSYEHLLQNSCFAQHAFPAMVRNKHDIDYHHQAEYVFSNGGIFANIASSYIKAIAQNPPSGGGGVYLDDQL
jgi:hypothetical protein